jgi:LuxR family transcriptional regulator, quorum-sensing system regulator BjaR1
MRIEEFIEASNRAASVDELFDLYKKAMAELGFDRLIFSLMTDHLAIARRAGHGLMLNYPEDWMNFYAEKRLETADPVRHKMYVAPGVFTWKSLSHPGLTKIQTNCLSFGDEAGLHDGIGIPLRGPRGAIAGIGAASSAGGVLDDKNTLSSAQLLSQQFYTAFLSLEQKPQEAPFVMLSDREQEVLKWSARGKTRTEIADIMCLSENTVSFHNKNILRKLDANNITLAVLKALHMGLIQI